MDRLQQTNSDHDPDPNRDPDPDWDPYPNRDPGVANVCRRVWSWRARGLANISGFSNAQIGTVNDFFKNKYY